MNLKRIIKTGLAVVVLLLTSVHCNAETWVGLKTNLINDIALSPNLGLEFGMAPKWSMQLSGQVNSWTVDNRKWKHALIELEPRFWFCQRFAGHFLGLQLMGGFYNFGNLNIPINFLGSNFKNLKDQRYQGWAYGAGITYGYAWPLHKHWNMEAEIGIGWLHTRYDTYPCAECGTKIESNQPHDYFGPTKLAVSLVYLF